MPSAHRAPQKALFAVIAFVVLLVLYTGQLRSSTYHKSTTVAGRQQAHDEDWMGARSSSDAAGSMHSHGHTSAKPEKEGAGIMFVTQPGHKVLLLRRRSKHHGNKWGLPGGNVEVQDKGDLWITAVREATEEMGHLPSSYQVHGSVDTRRGKRGQKHFRVFVAHVSTSMVQEFQPTLDPKEHSEWRWVPLSTLLPPLVHRGPPPQGMAQLQVRDAAGRFPDGGPPGLESMELHPVMDLLVRDPHRDEVLRLASLAAEAGATL